MLINSPQTNYLTTTLFQLSNVTSFLMTSTRVTHIVFPTIKGVGGWVKSMLQFSSCVYCVIVLCTVYLELTYRNALSS